MRKVVLVLSILVFTLITVIPVFAQDGVEFEDNWCFDDDRWGNGECSSEDPNVEAYMWIVGWCGAAMEAGFVQFETIEECVAGQDLDDEEDSVDVEDDDQDDGSSGDDDGDE